VEIGIWPAGIHLEAGEGIVLRVQGYFDQLVEFINHVDGKPENLNKGKHTIHVGGKFHSHLIIPTVPTDA
jgi:hypothetical protein